MGKLIAALAIVAALVYAWNQGWIAQWVGSAVDSGAQSVRGTQRDATKVRSADPGAPEEKKE